MTYACDGMMPKRLSNRLIIKPINSHDTTSPRAYIAMSGNGTNRPMDSNTMSSASETCRARSPSIAKNGIEGR